MSQFENISTTTRSRSEDISTSTKSQYVVKRTTFNYSEAENKKVELPEGEDDLKAFLLNTIKKEVSVDKIVTQFLDKNNSVYNMRKLDSIEFKDPEEDHTYYYEGKLQSICKSLSWYAVEQLDCKDMVF